MKPFFVLVIINIILFYSIGGQTKDRLIVQSIDAFGWHEFKRINEKADSDNPLLAGKYQVYPLSVMASGNTGPSHISAYTGVSAEKGGWVGNVFLRPGIKRPSSAFTAVNAESKHKHIITKLKESGYNTACLNVPTVNPNLACKLQLSFSRRLAPSCSLLVDKTTKNIICGDETFNLKNITSHIQLGDIAMSLKVGEPDTFCWQQDNKQYSRVILLEQVGAEKRLYIGPKHALNANAEFIERLPEFTCWPGTVDGNSIRLGKVSPLGFYLISKWQHDYAFNLLQKVLEMPEYDAVFSYTSFLDNVQHELLSHPSHAMHESLQQLVMKAFQQVSSDILATEQKLDATDSMLIFSDHGMQLSEHVIFLTGMLREFGISVSGKQPQARVLTSGALGHIYLNGVSEQQKLNVKTYLNSFKIDNKAVFDFALLKDELDEVKLHHPNSGDIVVLLNPGFGLDPRIPPTSKFIYPAMGVPSHKLASSMTEIEYDFLRLGTSNRVSPGNHGFSSQIANIDGIVFGTGCFTTLLSDMQQKVMMTDIHSLIEKAGHHIKQRIDC
jgi:hypothetical protein